MADNTQIFLNAENVSVVALSEPQFSEFSYGHQNNFDL